MSKDQYTDRYSLTRRRQPMSPERVGGEQHDLAAVRRVVAGDVVIPVWVGGDPHQTAPVGGTQRAEREVLGLIAEGMSNRAIAARLYVTERTVEAHVTQIFRKLHLPESAGQHRRVLAVLTFLRA